MRCCECEFKSNCDSSEVVLTAFLSCDRRNRLLAEKNIAGKKIEKTADQLFAEIGYRKNTSICYGEDKGILLYEKPVMDGTDILQVYFRDGKALLTNTAGYPVKMDSSLAEAISLKFKELEEEE